MSLYNFSSVDPEHYNRIKTTIPNHFLTRYVNICVSTFTSNCNIEVLNKNDYIEFEIGGEKHKVFCDKQYSKIDAATLPSLFEEWFKNNGIKITVSITSVDTIQFISKTDAFRITDMSYNMKLITGFYCLDDKQWPIVSKEIEVEEDRDNSAIPIVSIEIPNQKVRIGDTRPIEKRMSPPNARGFTIDFKIEDESIAIIDENGYIKGLTEGKTKITYEVRNPDLPDFLDPVPPGEFELEVVRIWERHIEDIEGVVPKTIVEGETVIFFTTPVPINTIYQELWQVEDSSIVKMIRPGYFLGLRPGKVNIHYKASDTTVSHLTIFRDITITVEPKKQIVKRQTIASDTVGYYLSTPILYLLTNIGSHVFYNDIKNDKNIQCGMVCMCLNNSWSSSFPIIAQQGEIITKCALNNTSDVYFILVDANMREVKLLNPMYITVSIRPDEESLTTPGLLQ